MPEEEIGDDVVTVHDLDGRRIALVFVDEQGEAATTTGVAIVKDGLLFVQVDDETPPFEIAPAWLDRIQAVSDSELRDFLEGAEFHLALRVGKLPEDASPDEFVRLGLKWPK